MSDPGYGLGLAAGPVHAEQVSAPHSQGTAAGGTDLRRFNGDLVRSRFPGPAHDLRNDIVAAADPDIAPDRNILSADIAQIIQRSLPDGDAIEVCEVFENINGRKTKTLLY